MLGLLMNAFGGDNNLLNRALQMGKESAVGMGDGRPGVLPPNTPPAQIALPDGNYPLEVPGAKPASGQPSAIPGDYGGAAQLGQMQQQAYDGITSGYQPPGGMLKKQQTSQQPIAAPTGDPRQLLNFTGLMDNPNILTRLGAGYNYGGLLGSLGLALTDMNPNSAGNLHQTEMQDQARRYAQQQRRTSL